MKLARVLLMLMPYQCAPPRSMSNPSIMNGFSGEPSPGHPFSRAVSEKLASPSIAIAPCGVSCSGVGGGGGGGDGSRFQIPIQILLGTLRYLAKS
ncbi:MAG: hypothetical protein ACW968_16670 [Candidatus Thorarchaeota archaeon]